MVDCSITVPFTTHDEDGMDLAFVPCLMVQESLVRLAAKKGYNCNMKPPRKKRKIMSSNSKKAPYNAIKTNPLPAKKAKLDKAVNDLELLVNVYQENAQKEKSQRHSLYEVEYISNFCVVDGLRFYFVKWSGWPVNSSTWEPVSNLSCPELIDEFHRDYMLQLSAYIKDHKMSWFRLLQGSKILTSPYQNLFDKTPEDFKFMSVCDEKKKILSAQLRRNQIEINEITKGYPLVAIENEVDFEKYPETFVYTQHCVAGKNVSIPSDALLGCECKGGCEKHLASGGCCPASNDAKYAYEDGLIKMRPGRAIFECNSRCKCPQSCPNRIVQKGSKFAMCVFKTASGKGWGLKALEPIPKGSFVIEYSGEIITNEEAEKRGLKYDTNGCTYLFDLDFLESEAPFTIDATHCGNVSHFINHSCTPNLQVYNVYIDNIDASLPRIALFAKRNIAVNEELTFDYQMTGKMDDEDVEIDHIETCNVDFKTNLTTRCLCNSSRCRGYLII